MIVIPAIDIRRGRCVRLYQGDPERETVYSEDPAQVAMQWQQLGARLLHIVDLDGAFCGHSRNSEAIGAISRTVDIPFQLGGGIRSPRGVTKALEAGAFRVILSTVAVEDPKLAASMVREFGDSIIVGIDARDGMVAVKGWTESSPLQAVELARRVEQWGVKEIIYTDILRDCTLRGPNLKGLQELLDATGLNVIISGGISSCQDLIALKPFKKRLRGVIIGQALYTNRLTLADAEEAIKD